MRKQYAKIYSFLVSACISLSIVITASPAWAQVKGSNLLQDSIDAAAGSEKAMDKMWDELFSPTDALLYNSMVKIATYVLLIGFLFMMYGFAKAAKEGNTQKVVEVVLWGFLVWILLYDNGSMLKSVTKGSRDFINVQARSVLAVQVGSLKIRDAMQDVILTEQVVTRVKAAFTGCDAKEGEQQLDCLLLGAEEADRILKEYEDKNFRFPGLSRFSKRVQDLSAVLAEEKAAAGKKTFNQIDFSRVVLEVAFESGSNAGTKQLLKSFQNWFSYGYEFAMMLTGLLGPLAVATSIIPKQPRAIFSWAIGFLSIGILKISYNLVVGFAALYAVNAEIQELGQSGFLLMMSIGAPLISVAIAGGGGAAIFFALGRSTAMVATIIPVGGSIAGSIARK